MLQPIESPPASLRAAVGRLHHARPAAGDHRIAALGEASADLPRRDVVRGVLGDARGSEDRDGHAHAREHVEAVDELAHDAQHAPRIGVDEPRILLALEQALVGLPHALFRRPLGRDAADAPLGPLLVAHTLSTTRIVPARTDASTLPPESTTPMRSPGTAPAEITAIGHRRRGLDQQLRGVPHERHRGARGIVADERDARAQLAQHRERALADLHRARAVGDRRGRVVEAHPAAFRKRALRVGRGGGLGPVDPRQGRGQAAGERSAREQPAAADRRDHGVQARHVLEQLERGRTLTRDHVPVVERMDEREPFALREVAGDLLAVRRIDPVGDDFAP